MERIIDADAIAELLKCQAELHKSDGLLERSYGVLDAYKYVLRATIDAVPVIRCKDCKHWFDIDDGRQKHHMCADIYGDWFCADAERRTDV